VMVHAQTAAEAVVVRAQTAAEAVTAHVRFVQVPHGVLHAAEPEMTAEDPDLA
jgi:hypothetical protein